MRTSGFIGYMKLELEESRHMRFCDTHAHYDDEAFDADRARLLGGGLHDEGVEFVVNMGASLEGAERSAELAGRYEEVYAGCGIHPDEVGIFGEEGSSQALSVMARLHSLLEQPKVVCVGEIGLDYHWMVQPKEIQRKWFAAQLHLAAELNLPINVHSREAAQDTFDVIVKHHTRAGRTLSGGIIHCYSGSVEMARAYVKLGYHIGVGGVVTFKNARVLKEVVQTLPLESLVTETDCPYMAPEPVRGTRNDSRNIRYVIAKIAALREMDEEACAAALLKNAKDVYRLG